MTKSKIEHRSQGKALPMVRCRDPAFKTNNTKIKCLGIQIGNFK